MKIETFFLWPGRTDVRLTAFLHTGEERVPGTVRPAVIVCPGGAYLVCPRDSSEGDPVAMNFAADGYQCFVLEYSVKSQSRPEDTLFPAQLLDMGRAFSTLRAHAAEWFIDPGRIAILGFSAGAHLCGMYATTWADGLLAEKLGGKNEDYRPAAAVLLYGVLDYEATEAARLAGGAALPADVNVPVFGCEHPDAEALRRQSPVRHVSGRTPPVFLAAAADDGLVPPIQTIDMGRRLQELGVPYELHIFQFGDHGFAQGRNYPQPWRQELAHACAQWVPLAKTFLLHQFEGVPEYEKPFFGNENKP